MADGEARFKVSVDVEGGLLAHEMVDNMIGAGFHYSDQYFPGLMSVCFSNTIPAVAYRETAE
jgi:hypothetical protein